MLKSVGGRAADRIHYHKGGGVVRVSHGAYQHIVVGTCLSHIEINLQRVEGQGRVKLRQYGHAIGLFVGKVAEEIHAVGSAGKVGGR